MKTPGDYAWVGTMALIAAAWALWFAFALTGGIAT
jgi:ABC-type transporter Mla subunit MlaD